MKYPYENRRNTQSSFPDVSRRDLRADCGNCFGLCCVALYFSASEGFPVDKDAGKPCINLQQDFRCGVHENLSSLGLKGCTSYECFGAGQQVAKVTYGGHDWRQVPESAMQMYNVFLVMRQTYEMIWYLTEALAIQSSREIHDELSSMLCEIERLTLLSPDSLMDLDIAAHGAEVNKLLLKTSELVRTKIRRGQKSSLKGRKVIGRGLDLIGADLRRANLRGENLRGAYLIAADLRGVDLSGADLIGADLRDADLRGANLSDSIFLTQAQINSAKGDSNTKLPVVLTPPTHWSK
jgi:uncharacterized protein YjbI with pentapeptide repeats